MEVRQRRRDDMRTLALVAARVHETDGYPILLSDGGFEVFLTEPEPLAAWVAVCEDRLVGHVALNAETAWPVMQLVADLMPEQAVAYIARLLVDPSARRQGVGRMLLDCARRAAVDRGRVPVLDVVDTPAAVAALSLYRREGWEEIGRVTFALAETEIHELVFRGSTA